VVCKKNNIINAYVADSAGLYLQNGNIKPDLNTQMDWLAQQIASNPYDLLIKSIAYDFKDDGQITVNVERGINTRDSRNIGNKDRHTPVESQWYQALAALNKIQRVIQAINSNNIYNNTLFQTTMLITIQESLNRLNSAWGTNVQINVQTADAALKTIAQLINEINNKKI